MEWLEEIDRNLFLWFNSFHSDFFDQVFWIISEKLFGVPFYLVGAVLLIKKYNWKKGLILITGAILAVVIADQASRHLFKEVFERWRPSHNLEIKDAVHLVNNYKGGVNSFVSSHAANMFAVATFIGLAYNRKVLWIGLFIAAIIAYSRIYLGVHYPGDILCGALLGMLLGWLVFRVYSNSLNLSKAK